MSTPKPKASYLNIIECTPDMTCFDARKTKVFHVWAKAGGQLGVICFRPQWRKYVFEPFGCTTFDHGCLDEIATFLMAETVRWRNSLNGKE